MATTQMKTRIPLINDLYTWGGEIVVPHRRIMLATEQGKLPDDIDPDGYNPDGYLFALRNKGRVCEDWITKYAELTDKFEAFTKTVLGDAGAQVDEHFVHSGSGGTVGIRYFDREAAWSYADTSICFLTGRHEGGISPASGILSVTVSSQFFVRDYVSGGESERGFACDPHSVVVEALLEGVAEKAVESVQGRIKDLFSGFDNKTKQEGDDIC